MSMYDNNHYNIVISLQLIKINEKKKTIELLFIYNFIKNNKQIYFTLLSANSNKCSILRD